MEDESIIKLEDRIILALDDWEFVYECINFLDKLSRTPYAVKIHSLWDKQGSVAVEQWRKGENCERSRSGFFNCVRGWRSRNDAGGS